MLKRIWVVSGLVLSLALSASGCKQQPKIIDHVVFKPSENLEVVRVSLVFTNNVQTNVSGSFTIMNYGTLFANPYTPTEPFEVGFDLDTDIVNEQQFVHLEPTTVLPNGLPLGLPYAVVEIRKPTPISPNFDIYGYVDVLHGAWLGVATLFGFVDNYFPEDLSVSQVFFRDDQGRPGVLASVFGPTLDNNGNVTRSGGISLFANIKQLIHKGMLKPGQELVLRPEPGVFSFAGRAANRYVGHPQELMGLEGRYLEGLNRLR